MHREILHDWEEWLSENRDAIDAQIRTGLDELDRGQGIPADQLDAFLQRLKAEPE